jgi:CCR4-NOT transcription complex subunit 2
MNTRSIVCPIVLTSNAPSSNQPNQSIKSATSPPPNLMNPSQPSTSSQPFHSSELSQTHPSLQLPPGMSHYAASHDPSIPLTKPAQQLVASPVDKWGLRALLRLIRTGGRDDQLTLSLGEDLANIGLDMNSAGSVNNRF